MRIVGRESLENFVYYHSDARAQIDAWLCEVKEARWRSSQDISERYTNANILTDNRTIFNLKGSNYELEVKINYPNQIVLIIDIRICDDGMELLRRA